MFMFMGAIATTISENALGSDHAGDVVAWLLVRKAAFSIFIANLATINDDVEEGVIVDHGLDILHLGFL